MTDIVERLRETANDTKGFYGRLYLEAADEIEKLRAVAERSEHQSGDNPITRAVGWWEGPIPAAGRAADAEIMRIWRECGLPEYFLGNGGSNHKLVAFAKACAADEIEKLRAQVISLQSSLDAGPPIPGKKTPNALKGSNDS